MQKYRAFTLMEILVVVAIVGVLIAIATPVVNGLSNKGLDSRSFANLRQWGTGVAAYLVDSNQQLPYEGHQENPSWNQVANDVRNEQAWFNVIPPYVNAKPLRELTPVERQQLYTNKNTSIFQCPRAKWVGNEGSASGPRFSYAFNSKIFSGSNNLERTIYVYQVTDHGGPNVNRRTVAPSTVPMLLGARASTREPKLMSGMNNDAGTALA